MFLDNIIDPTSILDGVRGIFYYHIRGVTRGTDMHIPIAEYSLPYSCRMCIYFLDSIETTFTYYAREDGELLDPDHSRVRDDEEIEFIIDPTQKDEGKEHDPVE
jgi:hypothetical protein